jgi:hypothetical protein
VAFAALWMPFHKKILIPDKESMNWIEARPVFYGLADYFVV